MKPFAAKLRSGQQFIGIGLSEPDLLRLQTGESISIDLAAVGVGIWVSDSDGKRSFVQPRESRIVLIRGDTNEDIGRYLNVKL